MPDILLEPRFVHADGANSSLEQQVAEAEEEVKKQRETIAHLAAEGHEVTAARRQLISLFENLALLKKLWGA